MIFHHEPDIYLKLKWRRGTLLVMGKRTLLRMLLEKSEPIPSPRTVITVAVMK